MVASIFVEMTGSIVDRNMEFRKYAKDFMFAIGRRRLKSIFTYVRRSKASGLLYIFNHM